MIDPEKHEATPFANGNTPREGVYHDGSFMSDRGVAHDIWASKHPQELSLLTSAGILGPDNQEWHNVGDHVLVVNAVSAIIAEQVEGAGKPVDSMVIDQASILHDASKRINKEQGIGYADEYSSSSLEDLLTPFGYEPDVIKTAKYTGRVPEIYIVDKSDQKAAIAQVPIERLIVAYADARVRNTRVVPLEQARDLNKEKVPEDADFYDDWYKFYKNVEDYIFGMLESSGFVSSDIDDKSVAEILKGPVPEEVSTDIPEVETLIKNERIKAEISSFTEGRQSPTERKNEDIFIHDEDSFIVADGSTSKAGNTKEIDGQSGGAIIASLASTIALESKANGRKLVDEVTKAIRGFYTESLTEALTDPRAAPATTMAVARIVEVDGAPQLVVTQVGDTGFRINGSNIYTNKRRMDEIDAANRAAEIRRLISEGVSEQEAVRSGRSHIEPSLDNQYKLWNNSDHPLGFGYINGHYVPDIFINVYQFPLEEVKTLEIFSDGYALLGDEPDIQSWEAAHERVEELDPFRYKQFPETKPNDDRTVAIIKFK